MLEELIGRLDRMLLASPLDDTTMIAVEPGDLREIRDALERSNSRLGEGMVEREAVARIIKGARLSAAFGREFRAGDGRLDDVDLDAADAIITALSAPPPPVGEVERIEPEEAAWAWMEVTFPAPTDQDYSADEMVDAFLAGVERAAALSNPVDSGEKPSFRCHNCKSLSYGETPPKRCPECRCRDFAAVAPAALNAPTSGEREANNG